MKRQWKRMSKNRIKHPVVVSNIVVFSRLKLGKMNTFWLGHIFQDRLGKNHQPADFCNLEMWPQENWIYQMDHPMYFHPQPVEPLSYSTWGFTVELGAQRSWNTHHWYNRMVSNLEGMMPKGGFPYLEKKSCLRSWPACHLPLWLAASSIIWLLSGCSSWVQNSRQNGCFCRHFCCTLGWTWMTNFHVFACTP